MVGLPLVFLDRSLGRIQVPKLLRAGGLELITLAEHYGIPQDEDVEDTTWITDAAKNGWVLFWKTNGFGVDWLSVPRYFRVRHGAFTWPMAIWRPMRWPGVTLITLPSSSGHVNSQGHSCMPFRPNELSC